MAVWVQRRGQPALAGSPSHPASAGTGGGGAAGGGDGPAAWAAAAAGAQAGPAGWWTCGRGCQGGCSSAAAAPAPGLAGARPAGIQRGRSGVEGSSKLMVGQTLKYSAGPDLHAQLQGVILADSVSWGEVLKIVYSHWPHLIHAAGAHRLLPSGAPWAGGRDAAVFPGRLESPAARRLLLLPPALGTGAVVGAVWVAGTESWTVGGALLLPPGPAAALWWRGSRLQLLRCIHAHVPSSRAPRLLWLLLMPLRRRQPQDARAGARRAGHGGRRGPWCCLLLLALQPLLDVMQQRGPRRPAQQQDGLDTTCALLVAC